MKKETLQSIVAIVFIISGATGLIYQIVWFKYLSLFLGNTTYAQSVVLATFMGGLAIGASLWGRRADHAKSPFLLYGILELGIGAYCLLYPVILNLVKAGFLSVASSLQLESGSTGVLSLKLLVSLLTLLPPTILMGGTLPVLVKYLSRRIEESGRNVALLYFLNSLGAIIGSLLGGLFFIRLAGLSTTILVTAVINLLLGVFVIYVGRKRVTDWDEQIAPGETERPGTGELFNKNKITAAILVAGLSGLAAMIYEVTWVRLLTPILGSSTYSFTMMLVAFISGITIGSWIVSLLVHKLRNLYRFLFVCQAGVVVSFLLTLPLYGRLPYYFWHVGHLLNRSEATYPLYLGIQFFFCFLLMLIPTIFLGMTLPVASRIASRDVAVLGRTVGNVFSINTLGTVIGALAAGLLLIPLIGVRHAMEVGVALNAFAALLLLATDTATPVGRRALLFAPVVVVVLSTLLFAPEWNKTQMISGVFRHIPSDKKPPRTFERFAALYQSIKVHYYKEGTMATVAVLETPVNQELQNILVVNGKPDASSRGDMSTQILLGQLPLMFHPDAKDGLVIGLGSGVTVGSMLTHPMRSLECVEISPEVVEASRFFDHVNRRPLTDPRFSLHIEDALAFLKLRNRTYDVIVSEPSNPWIAGVGNLYTAEFFAECRRKLNAGGMMVQWFHLYEMNDETLKLVLRTFQSVFPNVTIWQSLASDVVIIGSDQPIAYDLPKIQEKFSRPEVREDLARILMHDPQTLFSLQVISEGNTIDYAGAGPLNTEDSPFLEYWAPEAFFTNRGVKAFDLLDERMLAHKKGTLLARYRSQHTLTPEEKKNIGLYHGTGTRGNLAVGYSMLRSYSADRPADIEMMGVLADIARNMNKNEESAGLYRRILEASPDNLHALEQTAWASISSLDRHANAFAPLEITAVESTLVRCIRLTNDTVDRYRVMLGELYYRVQDYPRAFEHYYRALELRATYPPSPSIRQDMLLLQLARTSVQMGREDKGLGYAIQSSIANPDNEEAEQLLVDLYLKKMAQPPH